MTHPTQIARVHYKGRVLSIFDAADQTPLYTVNFPSKGFKMSLTHAHDPASPETPFAVASFSVSTRVELIINNRLVPLCHEKIFNRTYYFKGVQGETLSWKAEDLLGGNFKLVRVDGSVVAKFKNKLFSARELGDFEFWGVTDEERDNIVTSGLAMLAMVQSGWLGTMILTGHDIDGP
ncbi:uncharacterized protein BP5553_06395 [Venustampulla echinocandica]|uniref:Uncharacterized protein n=1 Tax=Venustampulla echinocandica TaxID=2656787 RepID=A0A370TJT8_9HELO|nr:uncharacterized protein BP5553_06395 [Venustampulla echinocandica]RDL35783.1 hypothetical protein BP5553_06395 [Venustampulla echinocandica]